MTTAKEVNAEASQDATPMAPESEEVASPPTETTTLASVPEDASEAAIESPLDAAIEAPVDAAIEAAPEAAPVPAPEPSKPAPISHKVQPDAELAAEEAKTGKKYTPFIEPKPECKPDAPPPLTADHETKYAELLAYAQSIESVLVSSEKGAKSQPLNDEERMWLTRECLLRYLRATKWNVANSKKRLEGTLIWRREYGLYEHTADYISPEMETGKMYTLGFDNFARPCIYLNPGRQNTERSPRQVHALVFLVERVIDIMGPGQGMLALLIDFKSATSSTSPSVGQGRQVLNILQNHYPERLGRSLIINIPFFISGFFKVINPFIDPLTREKLVFNENLRNFVPPDHLDKKFGGDSDFEYDNNKYWPELIRIAGERRAAYTARWKELGSKVGTSEIELRGCGTSDGVASLAAMVEKTDIKE